MNNPDNLLAVHTAAQTLRCHTMTTQRISNLAEHSFGVALLCEYLTEGDCSAQLLRAALHHDLHESVTGDVPHPVKRQDEELARRLKLVELDYNLEFQLISEEALSQQDQKILKLADYLEFLLFCRAEWLKGNITLMPPIEKILLALKKEFDPCLPYSQRAEDLVNHVRKDLNL